MPLSALSVLPLLIPAPLRDPAPFPLAATSAVVMDAETGKVLYGRDPDTPRYPASTTKIMTTLLLLERTKPGEIIVAPKNVNKVPEASMHLKPGERISSRDLAWALMLRSANDGCYAAAIHMAGSVEKFAAMMNERARDLGCRGTFFHNPNGLNDPEHMICARDLALIAREAMRNPEFAAIVRTRRHKITREKGQKDLWMVSKNKILDKDPTADGIKTGWTIPSGHTYVGSATRGGRRLITAVLDSPHWAQDHENLLAYGFREFPATLVAEPGRRIGDVPVNGGTSASVAVGPRERVFSIGKAGAPAVPGMELPTEAVAAPVKAGDVLGQMTVTDEDGFQQKVSIVALEPVERATFAIPVGAGRTANPTWLLGGGLIAAGAWTLLRPRPRRATARGF